MVRDESSYEDIYLVRTKKQLNIKKVIIVIILILTVIGLIITVQNVTEIIKQHKVYEQYEAQILALKKQEEDKLAQIEKRKQEKMPKLTEEGRKNIEKIYHSETKRAFLTFDDGPSSVTPTILEVLKQENVKATFFVLGSNVKQRPEMVKRIYEEGHYLANHGYTHIYSSIYASPQAVLEEFKQCNEAVRDAIGVPEYHSHLFRYPGGLTGGKYAEIKNEAKELLLQNDIVNVDWNALTGDAETKEPTIEYEIKKIQETVANKSSVVILLHDAQAKKVTAEALPQLISYLREKGYEFKNFYEIIK